MKRHSTTTNLLESINDWTISLSNHKSIIIAYIDFKSAFDCISHPKLLLKLASYGIKGNLLLWISAFLSNRSQSVRINSSTSEPCRVTSGVPQGSVLGPLFFNLFVNDITDHIDPSTTVKLFADDLKLYSTYTNIAPANLQNQLNIIQHWSNTWQLRISYTKCHILTLGSHTISNIFHLDNNSITEVDSMNDLGITIDARLKFNKHINNIVNIANQRKSLILRCFLSRSGSNLLRAFKVYIRPILEYASTTWSPSYITEIILLERVQRVFTKRIPSCGNLSYHDRLSVLNLQSLEHRRLLADLVFIYNMINKNNCLNSENFFTFNPNKTLRGHPLKVAVPLSKINVRSHFLSHRVVPIWNSLPVVLVLSPTITSFKSRLNRINLDKYLIFPSTY